MKKNTPATECCLVIFAREPVEGKVKTRLAKDIGAKKATDLYRSFLRDAFKMAKGVKSDACYVAYASDDDPHYIKIKGKGFSLFPQKGRGLGARMLNAFDRVCQEHPNSRVIIIGTDSPHLEGAVIEQAFGDLEKNEVVLGPCEDGGFYLIGMRQIPEGIFKGVRFSTHTVLDRVVRNLKISKVSFKLLDLFFDIDTSEDLDRLKNFKGVRMS